MKEKNILRVVMYGEEVPSYTITRAFQSKFNVVTIFWPDYIDRLEYLNHLLRSHLVNGGIDAVFMQIQRAGIIRPETFRNIQKQIPIFNWTGDVREHLNDYTPLGKEVITLFSNYTDVIKMQEMGYRADYLQTGYDNYYYKEHGKHRLNRIVFIGNNYDAQFEQTSFRKQIVEALHEAYGSDFVLYGSGWQYLRPTSRPTMSKQEEVKVYNENLLALNINHIKRQRYYSDRQLRSMACGTFTMVQDYEDSEFEFKKGVHFDAWNTIEELIEKCNNRMINRNETLSLASGAADYVYNNCTWFSRVKEFDTLINKYSK